MRAEWHTRVGVVTYVEERWWYRHRVERGGEIRQEQERIILSWQEVTVERRDCLTATQNTTIIMY